MKVVTWNINGGYGLVSVNPRKYVDTENLAFFLEHLKAPLIFCGDFHHKNIASLYPKLFDEFNLVDALPDEPPIPNLDVKTDYILVSSKHFHITNSAIYLVLADHFPCGTQGHTR